MTPCPSSSVGVILRKRIAAIDLMPYNAYLRLIVHVVMRYNALSRDNFNELMVFFITFLDLILLENTDLEKT